MARRKTMEEYIKIVKEIKPIRTHVYRYGRISINLPEHTIGKKAIVKVLVFEGKLTPQVLKENKFL